MSKQQHQLIVLLALSALSTLPALFSSGCSSSEAGESASGESDQELPVSVEVIPSINHAFVQEIEIPSNILPLRKVAIIPRVPGRLDEVNVNAGDRVEEGQVVAQLDRRDYLLAVRHAKAATAATNTGVHLAAIASESAETTHVRMKGLRETGAITQSDMDKVNVGQRMGLAKLDAAQAQVQLARVGLAVAQTKLADTVLRAPFAGVVLMRMLDEGSLCTVMPPSPVMVIADVDTMKVEGAISERDLLSIKVGMPARVFVDALRGTKALTGAVAIINPMVDPRTRTVKVQINLPNPEHLLETGMSARIILDLGEREAVAVPDEAVLRGGAAERSAVFIVDASGIAKRREVATGVHEEGLVEITKGLQIGERVIRAGHVGLLDGARVQIVETESSAADGPSPDAGHAVEPPASLMSPPPEPPPVTLPQPPTAPSATPGAEVGQLTIGEIVVGDRLSRRLLRRIVVGSEDVLLNCYRARLAQAPAPEPHQTISVAISIGTDGSVSSARSTPPGPLSTCAEGALGRLRFPELRGEGPETTTVELSFAPGRTR